MKAKKKMERKMVAADILKKPYARVVTPDEDGSYFAEIVEFPGCFAAGKTAPEALENLESVCYRLDQRNQWSGTEHSGANGSK
jgi:hypothetical protein